MTDSVVPVIVLVALLGVTAVPLTVALPAGQSPTGQVAEPNPGGETTNRLTLAGEERGTYHRVRPDLGSVLSGKDDVLRADHEKYVLLDHEFDVVPADEREELVGQTYQRLLERIDMLETRESTAVQSHANGTISDLQLVQTRYRIATEAEYLATALDDVAQRSSQSPGITVGVSQIRDDKTNLEMLQTPVSGYIDNSLRGVALVDPTQLTIRTTQSGYQLATIHDGTYIVETTRFDNRDESAPDQFDSITDAFDYATSVYSWASEHSSSPAINERTSANVYWIQFPHAQGSLEAYLDAGTGEIYREVQELTLDSLPAASAGGPWTNDDLVLSINETPQPGPIEVTVRENESLRPVNATIAVDGTAVATTGADGTRWLVPADDTYQVTATDGNRTVSTTSP